MKLLGTIRCSVCSKDITSKIKVIDKGKIYCSDCNIKEGKRLASLNK